MIFLPQTGLSWAKWPLARGSGGTVWLVTLVWATAVSGYRRSHTRLSTLGLGLASALWLLILYFFRDPERQVTAVPGQILSPADGVIMAVVPEREEQYLQAETIRVSIFLSVFNVHVQRAPCAGRVVGVAHQPGQFLPAFRPEASQMNESMAMVLETEYGRFLIKQIAGILARRCVNYMHPGDTLTTGQRFGLIRFGSRVDLYLPPQAEILVPVGTPVSGGLTPIARLTHP